MQINQNFVLKGRTSGRDHNLLIHFLKFFSGTRERDADESWY